MVVKSIQPLDFINGGPIKQMSINFTDYESVIGGDIITTTTLSNTEIIFNVTEDMTQWNGENLVTEEVVRGIVRDELEILLRENIH